MSSLHHQLCNLGCNAFHSEVPCFARCTDMLNAFCIQLLLIPQPSVWHMYSDSQHQSKTEPAIQDFTEEANRGTSLSNTHKALSPLVPETTPK